MVIKNYKLIFLLFFAWSSMYMNCKKPVKVNVNPPPNKPVESVKAVEKVRPPIQSISKEQEADLKRIQELIAKVFENKVYFQFDEYNLTNEAKEILAEAGDILKNKLKGVPVNIIVEGHTDEIGTNEYNLALGERRARSVKEYLSDYGVGENQIDILSFGEEEIIISDRTSEYYSKNRRAQIKVKQE